MRWILLSMFSIGVLLLLPELAFADNCSTPGDCWGAAAGGAATAGGIGSMLLTWLSLPGHVWRQWRRLPSPPEVLRRLPGPPGMKVDVDIDIDFQFQQKQQQETLTKLSDRQKQQEERLTKLFDRLAHEQRPKDVEIW